jgi:hypothetical protein
MTRPIPLSRLSAISKQRSIRRPLLIPVPDDPVEERAEKPATKVEWPVPD